MKKITLSIIVASGLFAAENLPPITIKPDGDIFKEEARVDTSDLNFASTLKRFSGFNQTHTLQIGNIEGSPSRFSAVSWEGIVLKDSTAIDRQQTNINHLLLNSSGVSIAHGAVGAIYGAGGSGIVNIYDKKDAPSSVVLGASTLRERFAGGRYKIATEKLNGYIAAENRYANNYTAVSATAGKLDEKSEKDSVRSISFRSVVTAKINDEIDATIKVLKSDTKENYDAGWVADPNDSDSFWNHNLEILALEVDREDDDGYYQKVALHTTKGTKENHTAGSRSDYDSTTKLLSVDFGRKWDGSDLKVGANTQTESGAIDDAFSNLPSTEATQNEIYLDAKTKFDNNIVARVAARNTLFDSDIGGDSSANSYYVMVGYDDKKFNYGVSHAKTTQAPSIVQIVNPWGASNLDLKAETLTQARVFAGAKLEYATAKIEAFSTEIDDYIDWVSDPLNWANSKYENVSYHKFKGVKAGFEFLPTDEFIFYTNFTRLFSFESATDNTKDRIPESVIASGFEYDNNKLTVGYDIKASNSYKDGDRKLSGTFDDRFAVGYKTDKKQTIELSIKNVSNTYREKIYGYTPPTPKRTFFLAVKQEF